jgi:hypothetical protein
VFTHLLPVLMLLPTALSGNCQEVQDRDRRGFDNVRSIALDVDGDGKPDEITPRIYSEMTRRTQHGKIRRPYASHWITFDLKTTRGRRLRSFFRYQYGIDMADYWVYALIPCDVNKDGRIDLIFYSGDDTSAETIVLLNKGIRFNALPKKTEHN